MQVQSELQIIPKRGEVKKSSMIAAGTGSPVGSWALGIAGKAGGCPVARACDLSPGQIQQDMQYCPQVFSLPYILVLFVGEQASKVRYMGISTPFFHNLTDVVREELASSSVAPVASSGRRRAGGHDRYQLSNAAESGSNLAMFQITGELPLEVDLVFTGNLDSKGARVSSSEMCGEECL